MPVFEYQCQSCGKMYEVLHLGKEKTEDIICPKCQSTSYKKWFSTTNIANAGASESQCADGSCGMKNDGCCGGMCPMDH